MRDLRVNSVPYTGFLARGADMTGHGLALVGGADFEREVGYERRIVIFYDLLGWRSKINDAGTSPAEIGNLRRAVLMHSRMMRARDRGPIQTSTFSDNVVISAMGALAPDMVGAAAAIQVSSLQQGFLLRGGIAVGDIYHDNEVVFGPALNRAYELESQIADYPRVVLDPEVAAVAPQMSLLKRME